MKKCKEQIRQELFLNTEFHKWLINHFKDLDKEGKLSEDEDIDLIDQDEFEEIFKIIFEEYWLSSKDFQLKIFEILTKELGPGKAGVVTDFALKWRGEIRKDMESVIRSEMQEAIRRVKRERIFSSDIRKDVLLFANAMRKKVKENAPAVSLHIDDSDRALLHCFHMKQQQKVLEAPSEFLIGCKNQVNFRLVVGKDEGPGKIAEKIFAKAIKETESIELCFLGESCEAGVGICREEFGPEKIALWISIRLRKSLKLC